MQLGIGKEKVANITDAIKRYGNLSGFGNCFELAHLFSNLFYGVSSIILREFLACLNVYGSQPS